MRTHTRGVGTRADKNGKREVSRRRRAYKYNEYSVSASTFRMCQVSGPLLWDELECMRSYLSTLKGRTRRVVRLWFDERLKESVIAGRIRVTVDKVKSILATVIERLRSIIVNPHLMTPRVVAN